MKNIDRLIRKTLKDNKFGRCEECGKPISTQRLLVVPEATHCIACQREIEKFNHPGKKARLTPHGYRGTSRDEWEDSEEFLDFVYESTDMELEVISSPDNEELEP